MTNWLSPNPFNSNPQARHGAWLKKFQEKRRRHLFLSQYTVLQIEDGRVVGRAATTTAKGARILAGGMPGHVELYDPSGNLIGERFRGEWYPVPRWSNPNESWYRIKAWTGPVGAEEYGELLRSKKGFRNVLVGTEHVYAEVLASSPLLARDRMAKALDSSGSLRGISSNPPDFRTRAEFSVWGGSQGSTDYAGNIYINRVRLDSQGYNKFGDYFGVGAPLFSITSDTNDGPDFYMRANDRGDVKRQLRSVYTQAKIK